MSNIFDEHPESPNCQAYRAIVTACGVDGTFVAMVELPLNTYVFRRFAIICDDKRINLNKTDYQNLKKLFNKYPYVGLERGFDQDNEGRWFVDVFVYWIDNDGDPDSQDALALIGKMPWLQGKAIVE